MSEITIQEIFDSPDYYLLEFVEHYALLVHMDRDAYQRSVFCDSRISTASNNRIRIPYIPLLEYCEKEALCGPDPSYIFHMAHCGSTLLSRAIDIKDQNLVCREPSALRQLGVEAASAFYGETAHDLWQRKLNLMTTLLGRSYNKFGPVIVKANVPVNFIIPQLMNIYPKSCSLVLYFGLENYLLAILKSKTHRKWVTIISKELSCGITTTIGLNDEEFSKLSCP